MNNKIVLFLGAVLIGIGIFKPDFSYLLSKDKSPVNVPSIQADEPQDPELKELATVVSNILKNGGSDRKVDGVALYSLWKDLGALIAMDKENEVIRTTAELREANSVSGKLMNLNLRGKYEGLAEAAQNVVAYAIGENNVVLTDELRFKADEAFRALSWAAYEGTR